MKVLGTILICVSLLFCASCEKQKVKTWTVQYKVQNIAIEIPTYRITYVLQNGKTKIVGPFTTRQWESELINDFEGGSVARLEMEIISGNGEYKLQVFRDDALHEIDTLMNGDKFAILETTI